VSDAAKEAPPWSARIIEGISVKILTVTIGGRTFGEIVYEYD